MAGVARRSILGVSARPLPALPVTSDALQQLLDSVVPARLAADYVAGVSVAVVHDDQLLLSRGYGVADESGRAVDAATLFRVGSVSKVLTWTAVMQLVERGVLDETADLSRYLDFQLARRFDEPVTLLHLMTHSAGFESNHFGYMASWNAEDSRPLGLTVSRHAPTQVRRPGELPAYSNWGPALAGRIVELVSGMSFDEYVERHLLAPLAMLRSTFREPVPAALGAPPVGYIFDGEQRIEHPFEHYHGVAPSGSFTTTAADMAKFMRMQLAEGWLGDRRVLSPATVARMQGRAPGFHPHLDGGTRGFYETWRNGRRTIGHKGAAVSFESRLTLMSGARLGIFVACNTGTGSGFCDAIVDAVIDRFFPAELPDLVPPSDFRRRAANYCGRYALGARSHTKSEKVFGHMHDIEVRASGDRLVIDGLVAQPATEWIEVQGMPGTFRRADGEEMIAFRKGPDGRASQLLGPEPLNPAERVDFVGTTRCTELVQHLVPLLFALCGGASLQTVPDWPLASWLALAVSIVNILIVGGLARTLEYDQYTLLVAPPWPFATALLLACASAGLTLVLVGVVTLGPLLAAGPPASGAMMAVAALALGFTYWLKYWNLIGFNLA